MSTILRTLKPTPLTIILLFVIVASQVIFLSWSHMHMTLGSEPLRESQTGYGVGAPVTITIVDASTDYQVQWATLTLNFSVSYLLAAILGMVTARASGFRRPARTYGVVALVTIGIAFFVSIGISRMYWGYYFARPSLIPDVANIEQIRAVVPVQTLSVDGGGRYMVVREDYSLDEMITSCKRDPNYSLDGRILIDLEQRSLLPVAISNSLSGLPPLYPLIKRSGIMVQAKEGYPNADLLRGVVVDALDASGGQLVLLGLRSWELSNDHYAYYEMVFTVGNGGSDLTYKHGQRFFYDFAGMEGAEWYLIWPFLTVPSIVGGFALLTIGAGVHRSVTRRREKSNPSRV